jgi:hypothetical protein|nr:MAG TPA: hypothetical protein [Caudoviricetes sp.]
MTTKSKLYKVTTGEKAYSFHDQCTGITVCRGETIELTATQFRTRRIQMAINSGHLVLVDNKVDVGSKEDTDKLLKKMKKQLESGLTIQKISKGYTLEQVKLVAQKNGVTYTDSDTVESILEVLLDEEGE